MELKIENESDSIIMSGGGDARIRLTKLNGVGIIPPARKVITSYDFDGAAETSRHYLQRTIGIAGDTDRENMLKLMHILSHPNILTITSNNISRRIYINQADVTVLEKSAEYIPFAAVLTADDPYFYDDEETERGIFTREKLLTSQTVLPAIFSKRTCDADIVISGDDMIEPIYEITAGESRQGDTGSIVIENETKGISFTLLYIPEKNEVITIDTKNRKITSSVSGNIINCLTDDSFLDDLVLDIGTNKIKGIGHGASGDVSIVVKYRNKYCEALI